MPDRLQRLLRITPAQLRAFEATHRLRSVTRAASELHLTQPTVSVQLRELTQAIGEPLLERVGRQLRTTATGDLLARTVGQLNDCWQAFAAAQDELRGLLRGRLRIAAVTTTEYFVPSLIGPFAAAHPAVEIDLRVENRDRVVERLRLGLDDLSVMMLPPVDMALEHRPIAANPLVVIAPPAHRARNARASIALERLASERWLMREPGSGTRMATEEYFSAAGFAPRVAMSLGSNEAIKHAVAAGLGIAVISQLALTASSDQAMTLRVRGFPLQRTWQLVWRSDRPLNHAAQRFVSYLAAR